jgi:hypothetical protein
VAEGPFHRVISIGIRKPGVLRETVGKWSKVFEASPPIINPECFDLEGRMA